MKINIKSIFGMGAFMFLCLGVVGTMRAMPISNASGIQYLNHNYFSSNLWSPDRLKNSSISLKDNLIKPSVLPQRNITVWATGLPNKGRQKRMYRLARGVRYKVRVSQFTHFGTWRPTRRALKNDACYEFNSRPRPVSLPVIKTNYGLSFCSGRYKANHVYESQVVYGRGVDLVMWVFDTDYRDNYGSYYVEVIEMARRR